MGKFYPSRGVYPVWQTPLLPYKRDQIKMRDYVERWVIPHLSGLPHLPGEVNRPQIRKNIICLASPVLYFIFVSLEDLTIFIVLPQGVMVVYFYFRAGF